jgi:hypothetical protein
MRLCNTAEPAQRQESVWSFSCCGQWHRGDTEESAWPLDLSLEAHHAGWAAAWLLFAIGSLLLLAADLPSLGSTESLSCHSSSTRSCISNA